MDEPGLIRQFVDLTGDNESAARSVLMYMDILQHDYFVHRGTANGNGEFIAPEVVPESEPSQTGALAQAAGSTNSGQLLAAE